MKLTWYFDQSKINWKALSELYRIAPLGTKLPDHLELVYSNSKFKCFVYHENVLVGAGRGWQMGKTVRIYVELRSIRNIRGLAWGKRSFKTLSNSLKATERSSCMPIRG